MADTPKYSVSVAGVVVDERQRVLLVQRRDNGHWEPPGGVLELEESFEDGVRREVLEETGLVVEPVRLTGVYKNLRKSVVALVFLCRKSGGVPRLSDEAKRVAWFNLDEAVEIMDESYVIRLNDAFNEAVATRLHDGVNVLSGE